MSDMREAVGEGMNPGSDEALDAECLCPVLDNGHGRGYYGQKDVFVYNLSCPLHGVSIGTPVDEAAANLQHAMSVMTTAEEHEKALAALSEMAAEAQEAGDYFG